MNATPKCLMHALLSVLSAMSPARPLHASSPVSASSSTGNRNITRKALSCWLLLIALVVCNSAALAQNALLTNAANSLLNRNTVLNGGWAWQSQEQPPNYQTDIDVGASGIGIAFLQMYNATGNATYLNAAVQAGNYIVSAQNSAGWFYDFLNPGGANSGDGFSSLK